MDYCPDRMNQRTLQVHFAQSTSSLNEQGKVKWIQNLHGYRSDNAAVMKLHLITCELCPF